MSCSALGNKSENILFYFYNNITALDPAFQILHGKEFILADRLVILCMWKEITF